MRNKYTKELLEPVVKESRAWSEVCRKLSVKPLTGAQSYIKIVAKKFGIDFSHFVGQAWNTGRKFPKQRVNIFEHLVENSKMGSDKLKKLLWREGLKKKQCEECDLTTWFDKEAPLELDHINGNHYDNRLENLKILCANCHAVKEK